MSEHHYREPDPCGHPPTHRTVTHSQDGRNVWTTCHACSSTWVDQFTLPRPFTVPWVPLTTTDRDIPLTLDTAAVLTITEFLEARIAEDEETARHALGLLGYVTDWHTVPNLHARGITRCDAQQIARHSPARVLAECAAKRALMDDLFSYEAEIDYERGCNHTARQIRAGECDGIKPEGINGVQILAAVYANHPDYDQAWRVGS